MFWGMGFHNSCSFVCEFFLKKYGGYCSLSVITGKKFDIFKLDRILFTLPLRTIFFTLFRMWRIMLTRIIIWPFSGMGKDKITHWREMIIYSKLHSGDQQFEHWPQQQTMYMHPMPMPIAPPRGFPNQQKTDDQVCFICQMHGHESELVLFYRHLEWQEEVMVKGLGKRMFSGRKNAFLEWMKHVIIFATAFHYLGCILKGIFDNVFCLQLNFEAKREGPVGWRASTFTLLVFVSWFL